MTDTPPTQDVPFDAFVILAAFAVVIMFVLWLSDNAEAARWKEGVPGPTWWGLEFADVPVTPGTLYWNWSDERVDASSVTLDLLAMVIIRHKDTAPNWFNDTSIPPAVRLGAMLWRLPGNTIPPWRCIDAGEIVFRNEDLLANTDRADDYHKSLAVIHSALFDKVFEDDVDNDLRDQAELWRNTMVDERQ